MLLPIIRNYGKFYLDIFLSKEARTEEPTRAKAPPLKDMYKCWNNLGKWEK